MIDLTFHRLSFFGKTSALTFFAGLPCQNLYTSVFVRVCVCVSLCMYIHACQQVEVLVCVVKHRLAAAA